MSDLAKQYGMAKSMISTILKHKDTLKSSDVAKGVTAVSKQRPQILEEVEKLLLIFINEKQLAGDSVNEEVICEKARKVYSDMLKKNPSASAEGFEFKANRG